MKIIIVNKDDEIICSKEREILDNKKDICRVSALLIKNSKGQILLAKRAYTKKQNPGRWGPSVAGTVEEGESYKSNIIKEADEELGLKNIKPKTWIKNHTLGEKYQHFTQWFTLTLDKPLSYFRPNEEVAEVRWYSKNEILNLIKSNSDEVLYSIQEIAKNTVSL